MVAQTWQDCFEGEGIPTRLMPVNGLPEGRELDDYKVLVPQDKVHVIEEVLRKL